MNSAMRRLLILPCVITLLAITAAVAQGPQQQAFAKALSTYPAISSNDVGTVTISSQFYNFENEFVTGNNALAMKILSSSYDPSDYTNTGKANTMGFAGRSAYLGAIEKKADELVSGLSNPESKAKAIYTWIIQNVHYGDFPKYEGLPDQLGANPYYVWRDRKAICYGYAQLSELMLQHVGVPCVVLRGYLRAGGSHVWNAVHVNGEWRYMDATTSAGGPSAVVGDDDIPASDYFFLMDNKEAAKWFKTDYIECCRGDACYWPIPVDASTICGVGLDANGGTCTVKKIALKSNPTPNGQKTRLLPTPTRAGAKFLGWYTAPTGGLRVTEENATTPKSGAVLYAHWEMKNTLVVKAKSKLVRASCKKNGPTTVARSKMLVVKKARGALSFKNASSQKASKRFKVIATSGKLVIPRKTKPGVYTVRIKVTAKGDDTYRPMSKSVSFKIQIRAAWNVRVG